jgi:hypothetical protein
MQLLSHCQLSPESPSQTHPEVCLTNILGVSPSIEVDNQDDLSQEIVANLG